MSLLREEIRENKVPKCVVMNKIKFVKLWDLSGYFERKTSKIPTCQKLALGIKLSVKY